MTTDTHIDAALAAARARLESPGWWKPHKTDPLAAARDRLAEAYVLAISFEPDYAGECDEARVHIRQALEWLTQAIDNHRIAAQQEATNAE